MVRSIRIGKRIGHSVKRTGSRIKKRAAGKKIKKFAGAAARRTLRSGRNTGSKIAKSAKRTGARIRKGSRSK